MLVHGLDLLVASLSGSGVVVDADVGVDACWIHRGIWATTIIFCLRIVMEYADAFEIYG